MKFLSLFFVFLVVYGASAGPAPIEPIKNVPITPEIIPPVSTSDLMLSTSVLSHDPIKREAEVHDDRDITIINPFIPRKLEIVDDPILRRRVVEVPTILDVERHVELPRVVDTDRHVVELPRILEADRHIVDFPRILDSDRHIVDMPRILGDETIRRVLAQRLVDEERLESFVRKDFLRFDDDRRMVLDVPRILGDDRLVDMKDPVFGRDYRFDEEYLRRFPVYDRKLMTYPRFDMLRQFYGRDFDLWRPEYPMRQFFMRRPISLPYVYSRGNMHL